MHTMATLDVDHDHVFDSGPLFHHGWQSITHLLRLQMIGRFIERVLPGDPSRMRWLLARGVSPVPVDSSRASSCDRF